MTMQYIRDYYKVPAKRGAKIKFRGIPHVITSADGAHLRAKPLTSSGEPFRVKPVIIHPTWEVEYLDA
jgi:hypothetical protein